MQGHVIAAAYTTGFVFLFIGWGMLQRSFLSKCDIYAVQICTYPTLLSLRQPQRFHPTRTLWIQIRSLTQADHSIPLPRSLAIGIVSRCMKYASVIPDGDVIWVLPSMSDLEIVVLSDEL